MRSAPLRVGGFRMPEDVSVWPESIRECMSGICECMAGIFLGQISVTYLPQSVLPHSKTPKRIASKQKRAAKCRALRSLVCLWKRPGGSLVVAMGLGVKVGFILGFFGAVPLLVRGKIPRDAV